MLKWILAAVFFTLITEGVTTVEEDAKAFVDWYNRTETDMMFKATEATWNYDTNMTKYNGKIASETDAEQNEFRGLQIKNASQYKWTEIKDKVTRRVLKYLTKKRPLSSANETEEASKLRHDMIGLYSNAKICSFKHTKKNCSEMWILNPTCFDLLASSTDYDLLKYIWTEWRNIMGTVKPKYKQLVDLNNKAARRGDFKDNGEAWRSEFKAKGFEDVEKSAEKLFHQVLPLYEQLHTYMRRQLRDIYPGKLPNHTIPAHLLGNMWGQKWVALLPHVMPYKNLPNVDVTQDMLDQGYTVDKIFHTADKFFQSLNLKPVPNSFWKKSYFTKPDQPFVCHASSWDFMKNDDVRIKMCTQVDMDNLVTVHHEMGHIQYYLQYDKQHVVFRAGANSGFHEAIGDTLALSVSTPKHLQAIGLLKKYTPSYEQDVNFLMKQALWKLPLYPWSLLIDKWRYRVFDGSLPYDQWNKGWWALRFKFQGLNPPEERPHDAFDPAAKSHIDDDTSYLRYFVGRVTQFMFYKAMCDTAKHTGPLHNCDFYKSKAAGNKLASMLSLGSIEPWPVALETLTAQKNLDMGPTLEYFKPLNDWLSKQNQAAKDCYGWGYHWPKEVLCSLPQPRCGIPNLNCTDTPSGTAKSLADTTATPVCRLLFAVFTLVLTYFVLV